MKKIIFCLIASLLLSCLLTKPIFAGDPLDVFKGKRSSGYPTIKEDTSSTSVKITGKDVSIYSEKPSRGNADEVIPMPGILSKDGKEIPHPMGEAEEPEESPLPCYGSWQKVDFYVGGEPHDFVPTTITITKDTFHSVSTRCSASGNVKATLNTLALIMTSSNCPGVSLPMTVNYYYAVEETEDGKRFSFWNDVLKEVYLRK